MSLSDTDRDLCARFMPLAESIAARFEAAYPRLRDEIHSAAYYGLTVAADGYVEETDVHFSTFATPVIEKAILKEIRGSRPLGYRESKDPAPHTSLPMGPGAERALARRRAQPNPGDALEQSEAFERQLERFRPGHRPLLRLLFQEDLSVAEAASVLGLTCAEALQLYSCALAGIGTKVRPVRRRVIVARIPA